MPNKKIIILSLIAAALLIIGSWYYAKKNQHSADDPIKTQNSEPGISIGNPNAPATMEIYAEFLCQACARFANETLPRIIDDYVKNGRVKLIFYVFPPLELSNAALCAQEQGKFLEYHNFLFEHQDSITKENDIENFAINVGLDGDAFNACYQTNKYGDKAAAWYKQGSQRGVDSTPTFFINGQKFIGAHPYGDFKKLIEKKLAETK